MIHYHRCTGFVSYLLSDTTEADVCCLQNYAAQHARWAWEGDRKILASFWDQPGMTGVPIMASVDFYDPGGEGDPAADRGRENWRVWELERNDGVNKLCHNPRMLSFHSEIGIVVVGTSCACGMQAVPGSGMHAFRHGDGGRHSPMRSAYIIIYCSQACNCSSVDLSLSDSLHPFFGPPTHSCTYIASSIYVYTRSISNKIWEFSQRWGSEYASLGHDLGCTRRRDSPTIVTHIPLFIGLRGGSRCGE